MRQQLLKDVRDTLVKCGFYVSDPYDLIRVSFDLVARRDRNLLFIKVLGNVDSLTRKNASELVQLAESLDGAPLVIGTHSGSGELDPGVVYSRFGVPIISMDTFNEFFMEGVPPFIFAAPGGFYVHLDGEVLKRARSKGVTLGQLAEIAGVSRRTIQMYEEGMGAIVDAAVRLEQFLREPIVVPVDPFSYRKDRGHRQTTFEEFKGLDGQVFKLLNGLGYNVQPVSRCPFEAVSSSKKYFFLTGVGKYEESLVKKARMVDNLSHVLEREAVIFTDKRKSRDTIGGMPLIARLELARMKDPVDIHELIEQRRKRS